VRSWEAAPDARLIDDEQGGITLANHQTERLFGYANLELLGQKVEIFVPPRFRSKHAGHRSAYFSGDPQARPMGAGMDLIGIRKDGTEFPVEISLSPLKTPDGMMVVSPIRDVSERRGWKSDFGRYWNQLPTPW
jgi:PAS domain S-box-containing protein